MRNWTTIATFDGIDLTGSFVLSWAMDDRDLLFHMDFVLVKDHPKYQKPRSDEWACFRRGTLRFPNARSITGLPAMTEVRNAIDATGEVDFGHFDSFVEVADGRFDLTGEFGTVVVESDSPKVTVPANGL